MKYKCVSIWKKKVMTNFNYHHDPPLSEYQLEQMKSQITFVNKI
jgi:hypothetical protein